MSAAGLGLPPSDGRHGMNRLRPLVIDPTRVSRPSDTASTRFGTKKSGAPRSADMYRSIWSIATPRSASMSVGSFSSITAIGRPFRNTVRSGHFKISNAQTAEREHDAECQRQDCQDHYDRNERAAR